MKYVQAVSKRNRVRVMSAAMMLMMATAMPWKLVGQAPVDPESKTPRSLPETNANAAASGRSKWTEEDALRFRREFKVQLIELGEKLQNWAKAETPKLQPAELASQLRTTVATAKTAAANLIGATHSLGQSTYRTMIMMAPILEELARDLDSIQNQHSPSDLEAHKERIDALGSFLPNLMPDVKAFAAKASKAKASSASASPEWTEEDLLRLQNGLRMRLEHLPRAAHHWAESEIKHPQATELVPQLMKAIASIKIAATQLNEATKPVAQFTFNVIDEKLKELTQTLEKVQNADDASHPLSDSDWNNYKNRIDTLASDLAGLMPDVEAIVEKASIPLTKTIVIQATADGRLTYYGQTKTIPEIGALLRNTKTHRPNVNVRIQGESFQAVQSNLAIALAEECLRAGVRDVFAVADFTTGRFRVVPEKIAKPLSPYRTPVSISENGVYSIEGQDMALGYIGYYLKMIVEAHPDGVALTVESPNTPKANQAVQDLEQWCQNTPIVSMSVQLVSKRNH